MLTASGGGERDTSSEHGGEKWPVELPRQRGAEQTGSYEPVRHLGDRRLVSQLHSQVRVMRDRSDARWAVCQRAGRCTAAAGSGVSMCVCVRQRKGV